MAFMVRKGGRNIDESQIMDFINKQVCFMIIECVVLTQAFSLLNLLEIHAVGCSIQENPTG